MPRLIFTPEATSGLRRCRAFLDTRNKLAARRAAEEINRSFAHLMELPEIGRPVPDRPGQRELIIPFGDAGYVALYRFDADAAALVVLAFRHTKEAGV